MTFEEFKQNILPELSNIRSFAGKIRYANEHLNRIGSGSGRIVYDIDGEKVLKLARNNKGIAQNEAEAGAGTYHDTQHIVAIIYDMADDHSWLISEKAKKVTEKRIKELTGIPSLSELYYFLYNNVSNRPITTQSDELKEFFWENEFSHDLVDFVMNYGQHVGDMSRPSTYGEVIRDGQPSIVLTDYGLNDEVYDTHYNPQRQNRYSLYELYNYADGNDDILSDVGGGQDIRKGMWALMPYDVGDGDAVINENFIDFVNNRNKYPDKPINGLPLLADNFHDTVNNLKEVLDGVENKEKFYTNLLELQDYLIRRGFYHNDPILNEDYEIPPVEMFSLEDEKYATELANEVAGKLNLGTPTLIGGGENGYAYEIDNKRILKITADKSEADSASKIMRGRPQYLANVYKLYKVYDSDNNKSYFAILQENVYNKPLDEFRKHNVVINEIKPNGMSFEDMLMLMVKRKTYNYDEMVGLAKLILTDNPDANVNEYDRKAAYDYFMGLINIRQELLNFDIKSTDFTNIKNLGYNDGVLKYFDIGGYRAPEPEMNDDEIITLPENKVINEVYDKTIADTIAAEVARVKGLNSPRYISSGENGAAYDIGNNKVLKITKDGGEASDNLKLIGKPLKYIAEPYNVFEVTSKSNNNIPRTYAIILEKLKTDSSIEAANDRLNYAFEKIMGVEVPDVIEYYLGDWDDGKVSKDKVNSYLKKNPSDAKFFNGLLKIANEARNYGAESMDYLNPKNLGYKSNGELGFFDVGSGDYMTNPNVEKMEVAEDGSSKFSTTDSINQDDFPTYNQNTGSPSINNNLDANSAMYEDRKKSFTSGSKAVDVKKKCKLGGLGNTSAACNQGDTSNLEFTSVSETIKLNSDFVSGWKSYDIINDQQVVGEIEVTDRDKYITINKIFINPDYRGMGYADETLKIITNYADNENKIITLTPDNIWGASKDKLKKWYKSKGFIMNTGRNKDFKTRELMYRVPKTMNVQEYYSSLVPNLNEENIMNLRELPFKNEIEKKGGKIYSVGGAVRDEFLNKPSKDLDILITGIPYDELELILSNYGQVNAVGESFGILKFKVDGATEDIDVAIPRTEKPTGGGGHKGFDVVSDHNLPIEKDLERRDFTINAIAKDIDGNLIDPYGGQRDLENKIIRVVNPDAFSDDPLRMLRAVQFASRFGFDIEPQTREMIKKNAARIKEISPERILGEFDKIVQKGDAFKGAFLLKDLGLTEQIFGSNAPLYVNGKAWDNVSTMGEFIWLLSHHIVDNPAEFFKRNLKGDVDNYREIKAIDLAYNSEQTNDVGKSRGIAHNVYVISPRTLNSKILPDNVIKGAKGLLDGNFPKTVNELDVNGNDLMNLGLQGKEISDAQKRLLINVYSNKVNNNKEDLLSFLSGNSAVTNI